MEYDLQKQNVEDTRQGLRRFDFRKLLFGKMGMAVALGLISVAILTPLLVRATRPKDAPLIVPVAVSKVSRTDLTQSVDFDAEFRPYQEIEVHAKVAGFVKEMKVDIGDRVEAGQRLATLEVPELEDDMAHARAMEQRSEDE